jgi:hypothetical protein
MSCEAAAGEDGDEGEDGTLLTGSCSRLLQGGGLGLLKEEADGLDAAVACASVSSAYLTMASS